MYDLCGINFKLFHGSYICPKCSHLTILRLRYIFYDHLTFLMVRTFRNFVDSIGIGKTLYFNDRDAARVQ